MTFREMEKILKADGWFKSSSGGSHIHFRHTTKKGKVTVPNHRGDLKQSLVKSIYRQAELPKGRLI